MFRKSSEGFTDYSIQERGRSNLCAVFRREYPQTDLNHAGSVERREEVYDEASLAARVETLQKHGADADLSQVALIHLRARKAELAPR